MYYEGLAKAAEDFSQQMNGYGIEKAFDFVLRSNNRHWIAINELQGDVKQQAIEYANGYGHGLGLLDAQFGEEIKNGKA